MELLFKIVAITIISLITALFVEKHNAAAALTIVLVAGMFIFGLLAGAINIVVRFMRDLAQYADLSPELLTPLIKTVGIAIITKIAADMCKDKNSNMLSSCIELAGCTIALTFSMPLLMSVIKLVSSI